MSEEYYERGTMDFTPILTRLLDIPRPVGPNAVPAAGAASATFIKGVPAAHLLLI